MSDTVDSPKPATLAQWRKAKTHTITLPSSTVVEIEIPDLPALVKTGQIPNELVDIAIKVAKGTKEITRDDIVQQADFYNKLCVLAVKSPALTEENVADIPFEDREMIVEIATRQRDIDAVGHHLAGLESVKEWRNFRGLTFGYENLGD